MGRIATCLECATALKRRGTCKCLFDERKARASSRTPVSECACRIRRGHAGAYGGGVLAPPSAVSRVSRVEGKARALIYRPARGQGRNQYKVASTFDTTARRLRSTQARELAQAALDPLLIPLGGRSAWQPNERANTSVATRARVSPSSPSTQVRPSSPYDDRVRGQSSGAYSPSRG